MNRRSFLPSLLAEVDRTMRQAVDPDMVRLDHLARLPDERVADMQPTLINGLRIMSQGDQIHVCQAGASRILCTFTRDRSSTFLLGCFTGTRTIDELTAVVADRYHWTIQQARAEVRRVFHALVEAGACTPNRPASS